jgi:hypothetical protein
MALDLSVLKSAIMKKAVYEASKRVGNAGSGIEYDSRLLVINGQPTVVPDKDGNEVRANKNGEDYYVIEISMYDETTRELETGIRASYTDWNGDGIPTFAEGMHSDVIRLEKKKNGKNDWFNLPNMEQGLELGLYTDGTATEDAPTDEERWEAAKTPAQIKQLADEWGVELTTKALKAMKEELAEAMGFEVLA